MKKDLDLRHKIALIWQRTDDQEDRRLFDLYLDYADRIIKLLKKEGLLKCQ